MSQEEVFVSRAAHCHTQKNTDIKIFLLASMLFDYGVVA